MSTLAKNLASPSCLVILAATFLVAGCTPNTDQCAEIRPLSAEAVIVESRGSIDLKIRRGISPAMIVHAEKNQLSQIATQQEGSTLHIQRKGQWLINWMRSLIYTDGPVTVEVTLPDLQKLIVRGSGDVAVSGFSGDQVELDAMGVGDMAFNGQYKKINANIQGIGNLRLDGCSCEEMQLNVTGSGEILAVGQSKLLTANLVGSGVLNTQQLIVDTANITLTGSGDASIFAKQTVTISSIGSGNVRVYGKPLQRNINRVGSGNVDFD